MNDPTNTCDSYSVPEFENIDAAITYYQHIITNCLTTDNIEPYILHTVYKDPVGCIEHCQQLIAWLGALQDIQIKLEQVLGKSGTEYNIKGNKTNQIYAAQLRELGALKENDDVKDVFKNCNTCKYQSLEPDDFPCDRCCHRYINQYIYDDRRKVNTDADSEG